MVDRLGAYAASAESSADGAETVDISATDHTFTTIPRGIWVGGAGNLVLIMLRTGTTHTFSAVPAGTLLPFRATKVVRTGTTATLLVGVS